jgi:hypothetical protein
MMGRALNMATMAKVGCLSATIEETQNLFRKPYTEVWKEMKSGVRFPRHRKVWAVIDSQLAMLLDDLW